jgi:hypothetical protein
MFVPGIGYIENELIKDALGFPPSFSIRDTTVNAATKTIDTGYACQANTAAGIDGAMNARDDVAHTTTDKNIHGAVRNYGGLALPAAAAVAGTVGDAALATATIVLGISAAGTLTVTLTPPAGYGGTLNWAVDLSFRQNG